jgi:Carbon storage regulator (could also regulate swarming and quorum sensing)
MIGDDIEVVIVECRDGSVKLGIEAPKNVRVFRKEIFDEIKGANNEALNLDIKMVKEFIKKD